MHGWIYAQTLIKNSIKWTLLKWTVIRLFSCTKWKLSEKLFVKQTQDRIKKIIFMQGVVIYFLLNCFLAEFLVLSSKLPIIFFIPFFFSLAFSGPKKIYWTKISSPYPVPRLFSSDFTFDGTVRKSKENVKNFTQVLWDMFTSAIILQSLQPQHTCYVRCHLHILNTNSYVQLLESISPYMHVIRINASNENCFCFWITKEISSSRSSHQRCSM